MLCRCFGHEETPEEGLPEETVEGEAVPEEGVTDVIFACEATSSSKT